MSLSILIVDDQAYAREVVARIARAFGHEVMTAEGGHAALDCVGETHFDVAIIDRRMPDMDGAALALNLRATAAAMRLIAFSGDHPDDVLPGLFDAVLQKPVDAATLARTLLRVSTDRAAA